MEPAADGMMRPMTATFDRISWPVHTARLSLRPAGQADAEETWRYWRLAEVARWLPFAPVTLEGYQAKFLQPERLAKTLVVELDGVVLGDLMLSVGDGWAQREVAEQAVGVEAEIGYVLDPSYGGQGYATEAVEALIRLCFEDLGLRRVTADCFADNKASWRLMERIGMRREVHTLRESLHRSGEWLDGMGYALLVDEWRARRSDGSTW